MQLDLTNFKQKLSSLAIFLCLSALIAACAEPQPDQDNALSRLDRAATQLRESDSLTVEIRVDETTTICRRDKVILACDQTSADLSRSYLITASYAWYSDADSDTWQVITESRNPYLGLDGMFLVDKVLDVGNSGETTTFEIKYDDYTFARRMSVFGAETFVVPPDALAYGLLTIENATGRLLSEQVNFRKGENRDAEFGFSIAHNYDSLGKTIEPPLGELVLTSAEQTVDAILMRDAATLYKQFGSTAKSELTLEDIAATIDQVSAQVQPFESITPIAYTIEPQTLAATNNRVLSAWFETQAPSGARQQVKLSFEEVVANWEMLRFDLSNIEQ